MPCVLAIDKAYFFHPAFTHHFIFPEPGAHDGLLALAILAPVEVLGHSHTTEGVASMIEVPGLAWFVDKSPSWILAAQKKVFLKRRTVEQPRVGRHGGRMAG